MSAIPPLSGGKQTSREWAVTAAFDPQPTKLLQTISECGRPSDRPLKRKTCVRANPIAVSLSRIGLAQLSRRLLGYTNKYGTGQFAISTDERCVVGLVVLTKNGRWPGVGVFFGQGFVGRVIMVKFCADRRLSCLHQGRL